MNEPPQKPNVILTNGLKFKVAYWEPEHVERTGFWRKKVTIPGRYQYFTKYDGNLVCSHRVFDTIEEARAFLSPPKWVIAEEVKP